MKKTLIALAALASTAAFAQSTVTLSGVVDTGFQKTASGAPLEMAASRNGTSNWTLAGSEDLGGGLKANFKISTAFNSDVGTTTGTVLGNNDMWVGLSGGFGSFTLGRSTNTVFNHALTANGTKGVTGYNSVGVALNNAGVYVANQLNYVSPTFAGFTVTASYAPSEAANVSANTGLGIRYASGPLTLTAATAHMTDGAGARNLGRNITAANFAATGANATAKQLMQLAAAYDFGIAKAFFTWQDDRNLAANADTAWSLGVTAPVGPGTLWASYDVKELAGTDGKALQVGYKYPLSKRTLVYAQVGNKNQALRFLNTPTATSGSTGYGFGLQHSF